ncbi:MAG: hypothetical protein COA78_23500 [Blastopirellula sp.]|nr:MAG: hypothetical protein COA78_23500 [Blastopirellula sp.]
MYKLVLCLRYLRTRYIALASIISVMLGVATMIVVNSVMSGFSHEMHTRLHGIMSDIVMESHGMNGFRHWEEHIKNVKEVIGDDIESITATVHVPAMLSINVRGQWLPRHVTLVGIDPDTYAKVSDFSKYLKHPENRSAVSFDLKENGYEAPTESPLFSAGWNHRREKAAYEKELRAQMKRFQVFEETGRYPNEIIISNQPTPVAPPQQPNPLRTVNHEEEVPIIPPHANDADAPPLPGAVPAELLINQEESPYDVANKGADRFSAARGTLKTKIYDPMHDQATGIILGIAIGSVRQRNAEGIVKDYFMVLPGDDVKLSFPTSSSPPQIASDTFTVVDFYESKMSEYDGAFAFIPLDRLQQLRGMIDPTEGTAVSTIQIKLKEGADLQAVVNKMRATFPPEVFPYRIQSWKDLQGPLLAAVEMEKTILNILLFLIIGVAGFGILATFYMIVVEKTKDIGILKSLGASGSGVMSIFLWYGFSLGIVGSGVGMIMGLLFVVNINRIAGVIEWITGKEVFDPTIYYFREIPTIISPVSIAWIVAGAMFIAVLASVLPALRAARLHPVEALRYE